MSKGYTLRLPAVFAALSMASADAMNVGAVEYDPNTAVYVDRLWYRVHAEDSSDLILKEHKQTMTLHEADRAGYRIGESGQSGRTISSFQGYQRKYPEVEISQRFFVFCV